MDAGGAATKIGAIEDVWRCGYAVQGKMCSVCGNKMSSGVL
jgi:hypothetical protein